jgi:hypothetical protein
MPKYRAIPRSNCFAFPRQAYAAAGMNTEEPGSADEHCLSELELSIGSVQIEQKTHEVPPRDGFTVTDLITVADIDRSAVCYEKVFGGRILSRGDS